MKSNHLLKNSLYLSVSLALPVQALAGGFGITVQSATGGGNSATGHALAEDASAMWYNPALLSSVEGRQINGGLSFISTDITVTNAGSTQPTAAAGFPVIGKNVSDPGGVSIAPSLYYKRNLSNPNLAFGLGINAPFGVTTEYDDDSFVRYESTETQLKTVNINPALALRLNEKFDVGIGANLQLGQATLARAVDSYLVCAGFEAAGAAPAGTCNSLGLTAASIAAQDGDVSIEADGVGYGLNLGVAFRPDTNTRISLGYRSKVKYDLEGDADFTHNPALTNFLGAGLAAAGLIDQKATADIEMPASATLAFARNLSDKLAIHGDLTWAEWSSIPEIRIEFPNTALADSVTDTQWENTLRYGLGLTWKRNDKTTLRTGIALDPTPTPGPKNRSPRAPSSDNLWLSAGVSHKINKRFTVDGSLSLVHPEDASVNYTSPSATTDYTTRADTESDVLVGALSVNYNF